MIRNKRGITLIALIVTIIVLLILTGVVINLTMGDNGIIGKVQTAVGKYEQAAGDEGNMLKDIEDYMTTLGANRAGASNVTMKSVKSGTGTANVPIPEGFYYVGGDLDSGVVISDKPADKDKYANVADVPNGIEIVKENGTITGIKRNLVGNQFVWIPCDDMTLYKKTTSWGQGNIANRSNCYWDPITQTAEKLMVARYKGFYVGRYEAGLPIGTTEFTGSLIYNDDEYNTAGVPQSIAGVSPWNFVDWKVSKESAEKMYEGNSSVQSGLITGTQWDITINKIASKGYSLTDSKTWGNYYDGEGFSFTGKRSEYKTSDSKQYAFGSIWEENGQKTIKTYYLLTTGASDHNRAYNIYDMAGNLWEWTDESAATYNDITTLQVNRVHRGGSFCNVSSERPACFRIGEVAETDTYRSVGFRAVLYIK